MRTRVSPESDASGAFGPPVGWITDLVLVGVDELRAEVGRCREGRGLQCCFHYRRWHRN